MERIRKESSLQITIEGAIITAFAMALNYLPHSTGVSSIQFEYGLVPMAVYTLRRGPIPGTLAGLTWGILDLILRGIGNGSVLNVLQGFLEYPVAFALIGITGIGYRIIHKRMQNDESFNVLVILYSSLGILFKYFAHFLAGGFYWGMYAPKNMNPWIYSLVINGGSAVANILLVILLVFLMRGSLKHLLIPRH